MHSANAMAMVCCGMGCTAWGSSAGEEIGSLHMSNPHWEPLPASQSLRALPFKKQTGPGFPTWIRASVAVSTEDVASSSTKILARRSRALAMQSSWRCPADKLPPPSATRASRPPPGMPRTVSASPACKAKTTRRDSGELRWTYQFVNPILNSTMVCSSIWKSRTWKGRGPERARLFDVCHLCLLPLHACLSATQHALRTVAETQPLCRLFSLFVLIELPCHSNCVPGPAPPRWHHRCPRLQRGPGWSAHCR